jgi:hypothetical protein
MSTVESQTPPGAPAAWSPTVSPRISDPRRKQPLLACVLSLMPGLGQVYVGYYRRGFVHAIVVGTIITLMSSNAVRGLEPMFGLFLAFFWLYNVIDAGRRAALYNYALDGIGKVELPEDVALMGMRGSVAGGLFLIALGGILLSNTLFDYSLAWLEDYWPLAPILLGVYLVFKGWSENKGPGSARG